MAKAKYKPLSFTTTLRNPKRIAEFLSCLAKFEEKTLKHDVIMEICYEVIQKKIYKTNPQLKNVHYKEIYNDEDSQYTKDDAKTIIETSPQKHKEAGFDKGWESRFDTWFKFIKELGFCYYEKDKPIKISVPGHMLLDAYHDQTPNDELIQKVFLNAFARYQADNPFRKQLNANAPLLLLLRAIREYRNNEESFSGFSLSELSFFICWPDNNHKKIVEFIKDFRHRFGNKPSQDIVYEQSLKILKSDLSQSKYYKKDKICGEAVDEYVRKMRLSGLLSLRGNGRYLDENTLEKEMVDYVINNFDYIKFETIEEYLSYTTQIDQFIVDYSKEERDLTDIKIKKLEEYSNKLSFDEIIEELKICSSNRRVTNNLELKFMNDPVRLEFLISVLLKNRFKYLKVIPSYPVDDEGLPRSKAGGGIADIICYDINYDELVEVTLQAGRINQVNNEIIPIRRHLLEKITEKENAFSIFIASNLHPDAIESAQWYHYKDKIEILTYDIDNFSKTISQLDYLEDIRLSYQWS